MRVTIEGLISPSRLLAALEEAALRYSSKFGDHFVGFYGAHLYLQAYASDGEDSCFHLDDRDFAMMLRVAPGESKVPHGAVRRARPASSINLRSYRAPTNAQQKVNRDVAATSMKDKGLATETAIDSLSIEEAQALSARIRFKEARAAEEAENFRLEMARRAKAERAFDAEQKAREEKFQAVIRAFGSRFIDRCNETIKVVWNTFKPVYPYGAKRGQPMPAPIMRLVDGLTYLFPSEDALNGRKIWTPLSSRSRSNKPQPHWQNLAWVDGAVPALSNLIDEFLSSVDPQNRDN